MDFTEVIQKRRSIRRFKDIPIPEEALADILESARLAPSGGNSQNWLFGVVTDKELIKKLAAVAGGQVWIATAPLVIAVCADLSWKIGEQLKDEYGVKINDKRFTPELVRYLQKYPDQDAVALLLENGTAMIPGEHICLAAVNHGLGSCWIGDLDVKKASELLELPANYACSFLIPVGYPDLKPAAIARKEMSEITFENTYGSKND